MYFVFFKEAPFFALGGLSTLFMVPTLNGISH